MQILRAGAAIFFLLILSACQSAAPLRNSASSGDGHSLVPDAGMVIGTVSYGYDQKDQPQHALIKLARISPRLPLQQDYLLDAELDQHEHHAAFAGTLPPGVYVLEEALSNDARFVPGTLKMPFEIQSGQVTDAGHYLMEQRAALLRTGSLR